MHGFEIRRWVRVLTAGLALLRAAACGAATTSSWATTTCSAWARSRCRRASPSTSASGGYRVPAKRVAALREPSRRPPRPSISERGDAPSRKPGGRSGDDVLGGARQQPPEHPDAHQAKAAVAAATPESASSPDRPPAPTRQRLVTRLPVRIPRPSKRRGTRLLMPPRPPLPFPHRLSAPRRGTDPAPPSA